MDKIIFKDTSLPGVFLVENLLYSDTRGKFLKLYQKSLFIKQGIDFEITENFYSVSGAGVIRGLHFQLPPHAQEKLVHVVKGRVMDVVLDLRTDSPAYGKYITLDLSEENNYSVYIPQGCAHGFQSLEEGSLIIYSQGAEYEPSHDSGINPLSLGITWPLKNYIISDKDKSFQNLNDFQPLRIPK